MKRICPYCFREDTETVFTREHVIQKSLGGNLTIPICSDCNNRFSNKIDRSLDSIFNFKYISRLKIPATSSNKCRNVLMYEPSTDLYIKIELLKKEQEENGEQKTTVEITPQILISSSEITAGNFDMHVFGSGNNMFHFFKELEKFKTSETIDKIRYYHKEDKEFLYSEKLQKEYYRLEMYSQRRNIRLSGTKNDEKMNKIIRVVFANLNNLRNTKKEDLDIHNKKRRMVRYGEFSPDNISLAVAKNAYNYLTYTMGIKFVRRKEFDPIRRYILEEDIQKNNILSSEGANRFINLALETDQLSRIDLEREFEVDTRYVCFNFTPALKQASNIGNSIRLSFKEDEHSILLFMSDNELNALVSFFGDTHFIVRLGIVKDFRQILIAHKFYFNENKNEQLPHYIKRGLYFF